MSDITPETPDPADSQQPQEGDEPKVFDEAHVKKLRAEAAKYRTEAKANAEAAAELAKIEEANKTEAQKSADALAAAQRDAQNAKAEALRFRIASKFQVNDEDADLFLTGTDEETLTKQAERLTERAEERKKNGNQVPREGTNPPAGGQDSDMREFARGLFPQRT